MQEHKDTHEDKTEMKPEKAKEIVSKSKKIEGWFSTDAAMLFALIDEAQKQYKIEGDVFEIGSHHGKSTVFLGAMIENREENLIVCDLFNDQQLNFSRSGMGDLAILKQNLSKFFDENLSISILQRDSKTLSREIIGDNFRFFHIDGGHNCDEALSDLNLAAACIIDNGVIILDDPFKPEWPGVTEALIRFLDGQRDYCASVIGFNKLVIVKKEYRDLYLNTIKNPHKRQMYELSFPWKIKELPFNGCPLDIFYIPTHLTENRLASSTRKFYRRHHWLKNPILRPIIAATKAIIKQI